jgi:hypothetical protein
MDLSHFLLLFSAFMFIFMMIQRAEAKRRTLVAACMLIVGILTQRYANYRGLHTEALVAFVSAGIISSLFWLLVGRYNPVGSSDDIHVIGMDD